MSAPRDALKVRLLFRSHRDAVAKVRTVVRRLLKLEARSHLLPDEIDEILVGLQEALANVARHAYAGAEAPVELAIRLTSRRFIAVLKDRGPPFAPSRIERPDAAAPRDRGHGLYLLEKTMHHVSWKRNKGQNALRMERRFRATDIKSAPKGGRRGLRDR